MSERHECVCHGEPMYWNKDARLKAGGSWRCAVADREWRREWRERQGVRERLRANDRRWQVAHPETVRAKLRRKYARNPDLANDWARLRRALKRNAAAELLATREIYERDGWICQLCYEPVDSAVAYPDAMSASLDHRIPLSRGGAHAPHNVQLAHLICNGRKGSRLVDDQWAAAAA